MFLPLSISAAAGSPSPTPQATLHTQSDTSKGNETAATKSDSHYRSPSNEERGYGARGASNPENSKQGMPHDAHGSAAQESKEK